MNNDRLPDPTSKRFVPVCAIGTSAGGVMALQGLLRQLPTNLGLAYVVIIHLSPDQPSVLTEILSICTRMPVLRIDDGPILKPNCIFVIPPDRELVIEGDSVTARPFTEPRGQRAPIDMFFRSIAAARGDGIAMVLSGAGADGAAGVRAVKEAGGVVMVQDPAEADFASMPQNAIASGVADFVAPLARLAERLVEVAHSKEAVRSLDMEGGANDLRRIVAFLRARTGHDFSGYKRATVMRRVVRRMQVCRTDTLAGYADYLMTTPEEAKELFSDLLISVTSFFRDTPAYSAVERNTVKAIFDDLDPEREESVRAWVVGCATGEEAYSLAILFHEEAARRRLHPQVQIFATDLDEGALATAREGRYPRTIEADVSEERLARFFVDEGTHFRVRKELRESVLFAIHSVIKEPPFLRLDLVSCRNLMIYLERSLQQQLCAIFHYGLKPGRYLFLGSAETADVAADLFAPLDRDARIYCARPHATATLPVLPQFAAPERLAPNTTIAARSRTERAALPAALHVAALERTAPASALVDDEQNVIHLSPSAGRFILLSAGPVPNLLPSMVRPELRLDLRLALARAFEAGEPTLTHPVVVQLDGERRRVTMHVTPVPAEEHAGAQALVFFLDGGSAPVGNDSDVAADAQPGEVRRLHDELRAAQEALVASRGGHEATVQDLRATNEELQSTNEEYRSTAEELETSKEELQSINEELHTVNAELKSKLSGISVAHSNLQNLTTATDIGTLFLDPDMRIKMFTPPIVELFNVTRTDIGRTVTDFTHRLEYDWIEKDARQVLENLVPVEREVRSKGGRWYTVRLRPYRTIEDRIDGTVVSFVDITERRQADVALKRSEARSRALATAGSYLIYRMSPDWQHMHQLDGRNVLADTTEPVQDWADTYIISEDRPTIFAAIAEAIQRKSLFELEHRVRRADGGIGWVVSRAVPMLGPDGEIEEWFGVATDVTERRIAQGRLRESEERLRTLIEGVPQLIWRSCAEGRWTWASPQWLDYTGQTQKESHGLGWLDVVHPDDHELTQKTWDEARSHGRLSVEFRILRASDGAWRWHQTRSVPVRGAPGQEGTEGPILEWLGTTTDIDDLKRLQGQQQVLVAELQHRTRNLLAVVRNVARRSIDPSASRDHYDARLSALGRVQGFLSRSTAYSVLLAEVVEAELQAAGDGTSDRVTVDGPAVELPGESVQAVALALHELATNAVKYGAIAQPSGRLSVSWRLESGNTGARLVIEWDESGVAMPDGPPTRRGYGSELITKALPYQLRAETLLEFKADGVWCRITLPAGAFTADPAKERA